MVLQTLACDPIKYWLGQISNFIWPWWLVPTKDFIWIMDTLGSRVLVLYAVVLGDTHLCQRRLGLYCRLIGSERQARCGIIYIRSLACHACFLKEYRLLCPLYFYRCTSLQTLSRYALLDCYRTAGWGSFCYYKTAKQKFIIANNEHSSDSGIKC